MIVAITHLTFADDRRLVERFPDIDLIIGGHEHFPITAAENRSFISKAGSDARYVARIDVNRRANGTVERFFELLPMNQDIADDPRTAAVVASYENRLSTELDTVVGATRVPLDADQQSAPLRGNQHRRPRGGRHPGSGRHRHRDPELGEHPRRPRVCRRSADAPHAARRCTRSAMSSASWRCRAASCSMRSTAASPDCRHGRSVSAGIRACG